jgi:hypothetical protein
MTASLYSPVGHSLHTPARPHDLEGQTVTSPRLTGLRALSHHCRGGRTPGLMQCGGTECQR